MGKKQTVIVIKCWQRHRDSDCDLLILIAI